ncbi:hypothetical protein POTOM_013281 [Populus tomentosa]|uniref:Histone-binding protein RBBP4-like N-terminal domain-containing protein n=1 Tax=Populus tomentosa TaxID=118781 RepID=A0A8X8D993_POPTO|nr:hypothetical protein POTOM_013281 [Populus tomentosa]
MGVNERYTQWKTLVPVLYDWLANHNLVWPSLSCREGNEILCLLRNAARDSFTSRGPLWGPQLEQATYKNRQRLHSNVTDGSVPNTLVIANCEVVKPRVAAAEHISQVNRIRELPQNTNIVATHTDSPDVLIWDVDSQPNRHAVLGATESCPDLVIPGPILTGHKDDAEFALAMCPTEPFVLSGGKDKLVVLWSIQDHISTLAAEPGLSKSPGSGGFPNKSASKAGGGNDKRTKSPSIGPRDVYQGHTDTVEDVQFCPSSAQEFCSVGDDSCLVLWDARAGCTPVVKVEKAHNADLHCVDWNPHDVNLILTGSADNSVHMFDRRNLNLGGLGAPVHKFEGHNAAVLCVQWSPDKSSVFGTSAEDGILNIWDYEKVSRLYFDLSVWMICEMVWRGVFSANGLKNDAVPFMGLVTINGLGCYDNDDDDSTGLKVPTAPPGLFFRHAGHRDKVVDFHWNASDPWTIVSVSDDGESTGGGGTLQIWRMIDLIHRAEEDVLVELENFKSHILACERS